MADRRRVLLATLMLLSLLLATADHRQGDDGVLAGARRGAVAAFGPVQDGAAAVAQPVRDFFAALGDLRSLRADNAALQAELDSLRGSLPSRDELERENDELRGLLGMAERRQLTTAGARVIAEPPNALEWSVLVDAGAEDGLKRGQAVVNADGLVGRVSEVTADYARVQLASSPEAGYAVRTGDSATDGFLRGRGWQPYQLEVLDPQVDLAAGAEVVTKAFAGSAIPDGIPVGVLEGAGDGSRFISVRPAVNFARLTIVQVVLDAPAPPAQLDPRELRTEEAGSRPPPADAAAASDGGAG